MLISNHKYVYFVIFYYCFLSMLPEWRIKFNIYIYIYIYIYIICLSALVFNLILQCYIWHFMYLLV